MPHWYADDVPADIVLVCGVFGNISPADITRTIRAMRGFCVPGGHVVWTRHRRPPDLTPAIRADFAAAGFTELAFEAPEGTIMAIGHHVWTGRRRPSTPTSSSSTSSATGGTRYERRRPGDAVVGPRRRPEAALEPPSSRPPCGATEAAPPPPAPPRARRHAWRTAKMEPARVIVPGLVIFGLDAIQGTFYTEIAVDHLGIGSVIGAVLFGAPPPWG